MKASKPGFILLVAIATFFLSTAHALDDAFVRRTEKLDTTSIRTLPTHDSGRLKPLDTLARETMLFITGSRKPFGLDSLSMFVTLMTEPEAAKLPIIEIRSVDLRKELQLDTNRRHYSAEEIQQAGLPQKVGPLIEKQQRNSKSLNEQENSMLEVYQQWALTQAVVSGQVLLAGIDFSNLMNTSRPEGQVSIAPDLMEQTKRVISSAADGQLDPVAVKELDATIRTQPVPDLFRSQLDKMGLEVSLYRTHVFWIAAIFYLLAAVLLWLSIKDARLKPFFIGALAGALIFHLGGFATRVYITGFAPVTNMYGTMLWVAFGVSLFATILYRMYRSATLVAILYAGSGIVLVLTEGFPLILNPGLDPVVAVLRSNLWLTIHVLTITISYAAFTITMLLGNYAMIKNAFGRLGAAEIKDLSHHAYRMIQLGVFLITVGIVLGGVWADYSWGRFWGWDPKETWALIADLGYLAILHARISGWITPLGILLASPVAYLLVIMAWYGVNFVLAAGLHSYGFSKGGAMWVSIFVGLQLLLTLFSALRHYQSKRSAKVS
jgi:ABC-type transport system involved in cytochrome c biogenesis permease subunit